MIFRRIKKPDPEKEKKLNEEIKNDGGLDKNDRKAMIISGLLIIVPVCLGVLLLMVILAITAFRLW